MSHKSGSGSRSRLLDPPTTKRDQYPSAVSPPHGGLALPPVPTYRRTKPPHAVGFLYPPCIVAVKLISSPNENQWRKHPRETLDLPRLMVPVHFPHQLIAKSCRLFLRPVVHTIRLLPVIMGKNGPQSQLRATTRISPFNPAKLICTTIETNPTHDFLAHSELLYHSSLLSLRGSPLRYFSIAGWNLDCVAAIFSFYLSLCFARYFGNIYSRW